MAAASPCAEGRGRGVLLFLVWRADGYTEGTGEHLQMRRG